MKRFLLLTAAVVSLAACSKSPEGGSGGAPSSSAGTEPLPGATAEELLKEDYIEKAELPKDVKWETNDSDPVFASPEAKPGGTFNAYILSFPLTLRTVGPDSNDSFREELLTNQFDLLHMHPVTGNILPGLASHWAVGKDARTMYFKLDAGAVWSDGAPVTSWDFAFALKFMRSPHIVAPWYNTYYKEKFEKVVVYDERTFAVVGVDKKTPKDMVYYYAFEPRPRQFHKLDENWVKDYNWKIEPNTGPYLISKIEKGKSIVMTKKKDWWGKELKYFKNRYNVEKVRFTVIRDLNIVWEHFKKGKVDAYGMVQPEYWHEKSKTEIFEKGYAHKLWFYHDRPQPTIAMYLNQALDIFKDKDVRIAFAYAMNIDKVLKTVLRGDYVRLHTNTYGHGRYYNEKIKARPFDLAKAEEHLKKAGWGERGPDGIRVKNGKRLSARVTYGYAHHADRLVVLKEEAKKAGIELTLQLLDGASAFKSMLEKQHEIAYTGWGAQDRMQYWDGWHSDNAGKPQTNNFANCADKVLDDWIMSYRREYDEEKKIELARKIQKRLHEEAYYIPLYASPYVRTAYWRWLKLPEPPLTKRSKDPFAYPFDGDWGGTYWIDEDAKRETEAAMKAGKAFPPVTVVDATFKKI